MSAPDTIARRIDYRRAALGERALAGVLLPAHLPRTADVVVKDTPFEVHARLSFDEDGQRNVTVTGDAETTLTLACQRCLEPTTVPMAVDIAGMAVSSDDAAAHVPRAWEPMMADGDMLDLHALIDDELLLALPITVQCERPACRAAYVGRADEPGAAADDEEKTNPFAALASLKRSDDKDAQD